MSAVARRMIGEAVEKLPYWERDTIKRHQDELSRIRGLYGHDKAIPNERQARLIRLYWRRGDNRKLMDYCRSHGLNPNSVIKDTAWGT